MDSDLRVRWLALELIERHGTDAVAVAHDRAKQSHVRGDHVMATIWRRIEDSVEEMLLACSDSSARQH